MTPTDSRIVTLFQAIAALDPTACLWYGHPEGCWTVGLWSDHMGPQEAVSEPTIIDALERALTVLRASGTVQGSRV